MYSFRRSSQIKCFPTHVDVDISSCFGMCNLKSHTVYRHHEDCTRIFNYTCQSLRENTVASKITNKLTVDGQGLSSHECRYEFVQCMDYMLISALVRKSNPVQ
jgi:hypothetical protein